MKKVLLAGLLILSIVMFGALGYAASDYQSFTVNPLGIVFGVIGGEYEKALSDTTSWTGGGYYWGYSSGAISMTALGLSGGYRQYTSGSKKGLKGTYWGVRVDGATVSAKETGYSAAEASGFAVGASFIGGYKWILDTKFVIDANASLGYMLGGVSGSGITVPIGGVSYGVGINAGIVL